MEKYSNSVAQLAQRLVSNQIQIRYRLVAAASDLDGVRLGRHGRLGADSFISTRRPNGQMVEVNFKPSQGRNKP